MLSNSIYRVAVYPAEDTDCKSAEKLAARLNLPYITEITSDYAAVLVQTSHRLELRLTTENAPGSVYVDFLEGVLGHRRLYGGGRGQLLARAVGLKKNAKPVVLDLTAGLGRDAFILAMLGCNVVMYERSPVVHALLSDGLNRARQESWFQALSLKLLHGDGIEALKAMSDEDRPDVIYLDPMFPERIKSALVKKEMRVLKVVVGDDLDAGSLLAFSLDVAKRRVVVKRSKLAPTLTDKEPDLVYRGKSSRFDVYLIASPCPSPLGEG